MEINADANIAALNALATPKLLIFVNGECAVSLQSAGKIIVTASEGCEVQYVRNMQKGKAPIYEHL